MACQIVISRRDVQQKKWREWDSERWELSRCAVSSSQKTSELVVWMSHWYILSFKNLLRLMKIPCVVIYIQVFFSRASRPQFSTFLVFVGSECPSPGWCFYHSEIRILCQTHIVIASYQESDICVFSRVYLRGSINFRCRARIQTFCVKAIYWVHVPGS
jgi:hypothetical protein